MLPDWLTIKPATTGKYDEIRERILSTGVCTVCTEARCPNMPECWSAGTATFMILGDVCTRGCRFCSVKKSAMGKTIDVNEPIKLANLIKEWKLSYAVLTSVCRDDLDDQGAGHFAACIREIKKVNPATRIEVLIPDFEGTIGCLCQIADAHPDVIGHNLETVERLTPSIRDRRASYSRSLEVLKSLKLIDRGIYTKSAIMLGMGEIEDEVINTLRDMRKVGVDFVAIGQYLRPSQRQLEVKEYIRPEMFDYLKKYALELGFLYVASGPFVRSSYNANAYFSKSGR
ncbi:MAG: lipoyl synthase [Candidatus Micrarchaeales archaeon]|jgi:lipoic acid synthetase